MALTQVKAAGLTADLIDETKLADNSIDSEHYNDASIDHEHLADDCVDSDNIADNSVGLAALANMGRGALLTGDASGNPKHVAAGSDNNVLTMDANGDFGWEAASGGISDVVSDTSPQLGGDLDTNSFEISLDDAHKIKFGDSNDLEIQHDGTNSKINNSTGQLMLQGDDVIIQSQNGLENLLRGQKDGSVDLYYDNSKKFETTTSGVTITGNVAFASGNGIDFSATGNASGGSASMSSELLDHYEEGTFSPKMTASVDFTMSHQEGAYTRVGNIVTVYLRVGWSSTNSATGSIKLADFPYNIKTNNGGYYQTGCFFDFWGFFPDGYNLIYGPGNTNYWYIGETHGTSPLNCTDIGTGNGGFSMSVTYLCND